ncbi:hypothetical protein [Aquibacillus sediminis]|uniref:hypothetical protein n=1 Tax=Aquibacillus sediminis TaxID=2574734 RepID=UPI001109BCEA|nr:hypothetical protein [Aquibacillus sediminis]
MAESIIYFSDNFFSAGVTEIFNGSGDKVGSLDLKSAFTSSVNVLDQDDRLAVKAHFPFFSRRWVIEDHEDKAIGELRQRFSFFTRKFEYHSNQHGLYEIESEAFSREYQIIDENGELTAEFKKISGLFEAPVYELNRFADKLSNEELIAAIMGVYMIHKRNNSANAGGGAT